MFFRECVRIAEVSGIENIPRFLLQFWPTHRTALKMLHHMGRFRIRRMVQAWLFRKSNPFRSCCIQIHERTGRQKSSKYSFFSVRMQDVR